MRSTLYITHYDETGVTIYLFGTLMVQDYGDGYVYTSRVVDIGDAWLGALNLSQWNTDALANM